MNLLSILGSLPASDSEKGKLGKIDYLKLVRMAAVLAASYCAIAILEALIRDISNGAFGIPPEFTTFLTGFLSILLEAARRKFAAPAV